MLGIAAGNAQFLLQAPNSGDETDYKWYEASDRNTILGTDFYYEVTQPGVYFATYDGTLCGSNATGYFIVTHCNAPHNQVTLDISSNVDLASGATVSWSPPLSGNQTRPVVTATESVAKYTATVNKAGNDFSLPNFTVVCMDESATLQNDVASINEDISAIVAIYANDSDLPTSGTLEISNATQNGTVNIDDNGTPNNPSDDVVTYFPNADYNGPDSFEYTICDSLGNCSMAEVDLTIIPIVDALDDMPSTLENIAVTVDILANDNDIPSDGTLTATNPSNGTILINNQTTPLDITDDTITYTPNTNFLATDTFTYTLCDTTGNCSTASVFITVNRIGIIDSDHDGIVDSFEDLNLENDGDPSTNPTDSDGDGVADYLDIDSDNDGIPDNVEAQTTAEYIAPSGTDLNNNGLDDAYENIGSTGIFPIDTDGDDLPDYLDDDSDDDGVPDSIEGHDHDHNGIAEMTLIGSDSDNDGLDDGFEGSTTVDTDVNDEIDNPINDLPDRDGDNQSDYRDDDDDNDGIATKNEDTNTDGNYANDDVDGNGIPDYLELNSNDDDLEVFNIVTPNGDGAHDKLRIRNIENFPNNTLTIYNRWGVLVFSTKGYENNSNYFDGTSKGRVTVDADNKLPVGTYFYILDYESESGKMNSKTGYLYINR